MALPTSKATSSRSWSAFDPPLTGWIVDAVTQMGFETPTPVQASTIPLFMTHKDVVVEAVTGSGKTLSFLIPVVEKLVRLEEPCKKHHVSAIIVSPTRELASQIYSVLQSLLVHRSSSGTQMATDSPEDLANPTLPETSPISGIIPQLLVGGISTPAQDLDTFLQNSANILVSTPGRLLELLCSPRVKCTQSSFQVLVMDEADRLLDLGFKNDLQRILSKLPKQRRTGCFSASLSEAVDQLVRVGLRNPVKVAVKVKGPSGKVDQRTPSSLRLRYMALPASQKLPALSKLLGAIHPSPSKTIVYLSTCAAVDYFQHVIPAVLKPEIGDICLIPLHGKHPPNVRQKNFTQFSNAQSPTVLLTTDVAARGLDVPQVDLVVQIDPPSDPKVFLHRCGRAGRAGRKGLAVVFIHTGREEDYVQFMDVRKTPITLLDSPSLEVSPDDGATATEQIRKVVLTDRAIHDKAQRGFVSWVRSYSKHQAGSIFRTKDLNWTDLANAWGLLTLPKMPELKQRKEDLDLGLGVDFSKYPYRDRQREKARYAAIRNSKTEETGRTQSAPPKKRAWSENVDRKDERERRRSKKQKKREQVKWSHMTPGEREDRAGLQQLITQVRNSKPAIDRVVSS